MQSLAGCSPKWTTPAAWMRSTQSPLPSCKPPPSSPWAWVHVWLPGCPGRVALGVGCSSGSRGNTWMPAAAVSPCRHDDLGGLREEAAAESGAPARPSEWGAPWGPELTGSQTMAGQAPSSASAQGRPTCALGPHPRCFQEGLRAQPAPTPRPVMLTPPARRPLGRASGCPQAAGRAVMSP